MKKQKTIIDNHTQNTSPAIILADEHELYRLIMAYNEAFSEQKWYKKPKTNESHESNDSCLILFFEDEKTANTFFEQQAKVGHVFIVLDWHTKKVLGYTDGTGAFCKNTDQKSLAEIQDLLAVKTHGPKVA